MMPFVIHECPRCQGAISRDHSAERHLPGRTDKWVHCEHCGIGFEVSEYDDREVHALMFVEKTEPVNFGKFLQRLEDARAA